MTLELQATPEEVMRAVEALQEFGRRMHVGEREIFGLALALEECGSNIVNHAYRHDPRQQFRVAIEYTGGAVTIELRDRGPAFDPTRVRAVKPVAGGGDLPHGGWGIQLARRYVDEMAYRREDGENILRLSKSLVRATGQK
jgi:sigma-B regulation protein RsbU (phosphoserine phosphatase)